MAVRKWLSLGLAFTALAFLPGCVEPPHPPIIITIDSMREWFEGDYLVVNVTITNRANFTPPEPDLEVILEEWESHPNETASYNHGLAWKAFDVNSLLFSAGLEDAKRDRYYTDEAAKALNVSYSPGAVGPMELTPGRTYSVEFVFLPIQTFHHRDGFYTLEAGIYPHYPVNSPYPGVSGEDHFQSGCFNHDVPAFYGFHVPGPDCYYYNRQGDETAVTGYIERELNQTSPF